MDPAAKNKEFESEEFLQVSTNIVSTFGTRLPVSLCFHDESFDRVSLLYEKGIRISDRKQKRIEEYCNDGNLFISKVEYKNLASHISENLGILLTEHYLEESDAAKIFYDGVLEKVRAFYSNPVGETLEELKRILAIYCEYVWIDPNRWTYFFNTLRREQDLACHVVNTLFVGVAVYLKVFYNPKDKLNLQPLALGLVLHDLGMTQIPTALVSKKGPFLYKERMRMNEHVDIAEKMLNRLEINNKIIRACVLDHHERLDGSGYPRGKKGDALSIEAKVCAIADVFCAMIAERWHRAPLNPILTTIIITEKKAQFDQTLAASLISFIIANNPEMKALLKNKEKMQQLKTIALQKCAQ